MSWDDFSEYVTHFTKPTGLNSEYKNYISICGSQCLNATNAFGVGRYKAPESVSQRAVCFSEVPLHCLDRIAERRSRYGIGFKKEFAILRGALPVWYVEKNSVQHDSINQIIYTATRSSMPMDEPIWKLTPFIDIPGDYPKGTYRFEWEREWRSVDDFMFSEEDVAFLIIPEELHAAACYFFREARYENIGSFYACPYIDSLWDLKKISDAFEKGWPHNYLK